MTDCVSGCTSCSTSYAENPCFWHPDAATKCQALSNSVHCSDPATTPEPTPPLTPAPTPPNRCTEANTCEVESLSECKTCYTGSSSNSLCESYNVNYESWYMYALGATAQWDVSEPVTMTLRWNSPAIVGTTARTHSTMMLRLSSLIKSR